jgi:lipopolysaccharide transport system permease protein
VNTVGSTQTDKARPILLLDGEVTPVSVLVRDLWQSRDLLAVMARKEFFVRYRRASFGLAWAVGIPLVQALVLAVVLHHFVRFRTAGSYPVFVFSGVLAWNFFSTGISTATSAIVDNRDISTKIYFPRSVFPAMTVISGVYGLILTVALLIVFEVAFGRSPGLNTFLLLPAVALAVVLTMAVGLVLAALQVYFRDVKFVVQATLVGWFYLTPVFYPLRAVGRIWPWLRLNPMTGVVELFRAASVGADPGWLPSLWWSAGWSASLTLIAILLYRRFDRIFADLL